VGLAVMIAEQIRNGMGTHIFELTRSEMLNSQKVRYVILPAAVI
jgi:hypothetical protein